MLQNLTFVPPRRESGMNLQRYEDNGKVWNGQFGKCELQTLFEPMPSISPKVCSLSFPGAAFYDFCFHSFARKCFRVFLVFHFLKHCVCRFVSFFFTFSEI